MITINFASRNYRLIRKIRIGLITGNLILAVFTGVLLGNVNSLRAELSAMGRTLLELEAADVTSRPLLVQREQITKDLNVMSGLQQAKKISWTRLLSGIEAVLPTGVALKQVELNRKDMTVTLSGMAQSPEALRNLVVAMERAATLKNPFLKHQSLEKGSISFNVVAVYQEYTGAAMAHGKQ